MPQTFPRTRRVAEQMRRELAELLRREIRDSRMTMVSITSVEVTRDLAFAKVYVTILGDPAEREEMMDSLNQAAPLLRRELGRQMRIRTVPRLEFIYDEVVERGARLSALISQVVAADKRGHEEQNTDHDMGEDENQTPSGFHDTQKR